MSGACDLGSPPGSDIEADKMAQASSLFAPEDDTNGDVEMTNISHKVKKLIMNDCLNVMHRHEKVKCRI